MNPGKVVDAYRLDEHLKLGTDYNPPRPDVRFAYQLDEGDFAHAALRCVGVGKCRIPDAEQVMCPSFLVTHEEKHTTRGRARLLFEMLQGEVITDGWQSQGGRTTRSTCAWPARAARTTARFNVDMPTYKAEFLHHHYKSRARWRPRYAYAFGLIDQAARLASLMPRAGQRRHPRRRGFRALAKLAAGMTPRAGDPASSPR